MKIKVVICFGLIILTFILFTARLFEWQIIDSQKYKDIAESTVTYVIKTDTTRGEIVDINGKPLAINKTGYNVVIDKMYLQYGKENEAVNILLDIFNNSGEEWIDILPIILDDNGKYSFDEENSYEIKKLKDGSINGIDENTSAEECINILSQRYKCTEYDKQRQRDIISVRYNMEKTDYSMILPYVFSENISSELVSLISEKTQYIKGIDIKTTLIRSNPNGELAPHIVGSIGAISQEEYNFLKSDGYKITDRIGKSGIEYAMEDYLRGNAGSKTVEVTGNGEINILETVNAKPGNTVYLTIDLELQSVALDALKENITSARENGEQITEYTTAKGYGEDCVAGAVVMLDVNDFSVLAACSYPTYDLDLYANDSDYYNTLINDKTIPLFNRAFNGAFAPGSVFKPLVASAALEEGVITENTNIYCSKYYNYYNGFTLRCMGTHGSLNIKSAIAKSCNYFFADVGRLLGIDNIDIYAKRFGLGVYTGLEVSETKGTLAGNETGKEWYAANTLSAAIGQSDNAFSPIQLAVYTATIANGGTRYQAHLVSKITDYTRKNIIYENSKEKPVIIEKTGVSQENLNIVKSGMRACVTSGTASGIFGNYPIAVAAKTGTAENSGSDHTTFICFAPYDNPEVAIAVVIEHGTKGMYSMNVAKALLDTYFYDDIN